MDRDVAVIGDATVYLGDSIDMMADMPDNFVGMVATDPPYGIGYVSNHRTGGKTRPIAGDTCKRLPAESMRQIARVVRQDGGVYVATRHDVMESWKSAGELAGLTTKTPIFWDKGNHTAGDLTGDWGARVEIFIFFHKGRHHLRGQRRSNLWRVMRDPAGEHPTPKPVRLMEMMVVASSDPGDVVLDPFMGSGSTGIAAINTGRKFIGVEIDRKYFDLACERISLAAKQGTLFDMGDS